MADEIPAQSDANYQERVVSNSPVPAPPEVKIRTMASDLEALTLGGGTFPRGETVAGSLAPASSGTVLTSSFGASRPNFFERHAKPILLVLILFGVAGILSVFVFVGYYFIRPFFFEITPPSSSLAP